MRNIILTLILMFSFVSCEFNKKKNHLDELNLNGKVKLVTYEIYSAVEEFGEPIRDKFEKRIEDFFDENGLYTKKNGYDSDGKKLFGRRYKYDDDGNLVEEINYDINGLAQTWKDKYDNDGNKIESNVYDKDREPISKIKFKYDDDGNKVEENMYEINGELIAKFQFKYDDDGNRVEENSYDKNGELYLKRNYKYDEFDSNKNWQIRVTYEKYAPFNSVEVATKITWREIEYYD